MTTLEEGIRNLDQLAFEHGALAFKHHAVKFFEEAGMLEIAYKILDMPYSREALDNDV